MTRRIGTEVLISKGVKHWLLAAAALGAYTTIVVVEPPLIMDLVNVSLGVLQAVLDMITSVPATEFDSAGSDTGRIGSESGSASGSEPDPQTQETVNQLTELFVSLIYMALAAFSVIFVLIIMATAAVGSLPTSTTGTTGTTDDEEEESEEESEDESDDEEEEDNEEHEHPESGRPLGPAEAIEYQREKYARDELTEAEFEERVMRILENNPGSEYTTEEIHETE